MTNEVRWRIRLTENRCYSLCVHEVETIAHALRDCLRARKIWEAFVKVEERQLFFSQNWYTWMLSNLAIRRGNASRVNWPLECDRESDVLEDPPSGVYTLLYYDLIEFTIPRLI
uniref:Reverse transcriptase zinc-binding domain-containing protein n=1 Tax=Salix viminalis TaxID=40686 RepID=A0A6N2KJK4_SALVM